MYYENRKDKFKEKMIIYISLLIIIVLLVVLFFKNDLNEIKAETNYDVSKLQLESIEETEENNTKKIIERAVKSVVGISKLSQNGKTIFLDNSEEKLGLGSGIIITDNGYILTNQHVAGNKYSNCYVTLENGNVYNGNVVWSDENIDLAIVKIGMKNLDYIQLADSDIISLADEVYAIGNPIGIEFQRTVTKGIISGINRTIKIEENNKESYMEDLIQTDATINEGNSGGALINESGELIGVNSVKISNAEGIGFAVPINIVKPIIERFTKNGQFEEAYLGIYGYDKEVIPYLDSSLKIDKGIYVASVLSDGPLYKTGIKEGDIITRIDDIDLNKMNDLKKYIYSKSPGDSVKLIVQRNNKTYEITVKLGYKI